LRPAREDAYHSVAVALAVTEMSRRLDSLAVRAVRALEASDIPCLLLRGPVFARWLYGSSSERPYDDVDLLVPVSRAAEASKVLTTLGLRSLLGNAAPSERPSHADTLTGSAGDIDLHWTVSGIRADPDAVWRVLSSGREEMHLEEGAVPVARPGARAFLIALHTAQHGPQGGVQLEDARRAVSRLPRSVWEDAAALARQLDALPAFAAGVGRAAGGDELLRELGVDAKWNLDLAVRAEGDVPMLRGLSTLRHTRGMAARVRLVGQELFPTVAFMRAWSPRARRGFLGLAAAYASRPFWIARNLIPAYRAYRRARRLSG
jgi:hypothetical protein